MLWFEEEEILSMGFAKTWSFGWKVSWKFSISANGRSITARTKTRRESGWPLIVKCGLNYVNWTQSALTTWQWKVSRVQTNRFTPHWTEFLSLLCAMNKESHLTLYRPLCRSYCYWQWGLCIFTLSGLLPLKLHSGTQLCIETKASRYVY